MLIHKTLQFLKGSLKDCKIILQRFLIFPISYIIWYLCGKDLNDTPLCKKRQKEIKFFQRVYELEFDIFSFDFWFQTRTVLPAFITCTLMVNEGPDISLLLFLFIYEIIYRPSKVLIRSYFQLLFDILFWHDNEFSSFRKEKEKFDVSAVYVCVCVCIIFTVTSIFFDSWIKNISIREQWQIYYFHWHFLVFN